jgi:uncharacterized membrane protein
MPLLLLKWVHILAAIIAIGSNVTYGFWLSSASRNPEVLPFTLKVIKLIDDRLANRAYGFLILTGILMLFILKLPLTTPWLLTSLVLYVGVILLGLLGYTPTLKRQIQLIESKGFNSPEYQAAARRGTALGILLAVLAISIVFLMVVKPNLWS